MGMSQGTVSRALIHLLRDGADGRDSRRTADPSAALGMTIHTTVVPIQPVYFPTLLYERASIIRGSRAACAISFPLRRPASACRHRASWRYLHPTTRSSALQEFPRWL